MVSEHGSILLELFVASAVRVPKKFGNKIVFGLWILSFVSVSLICWFDLSISFIPFGYQNFANTCVGFFENC
jgi:hypothetical protein